MFELAYKLLCTNKYTKDCKRSYKDDSIKEIYLKMCFDGLLNTYEKNPYDEMILEKNGIDYEEFEQWFLEDEKDVDVYAFAKDKGIKLTELTDQDYFDMIYIYGSDDYSYTFYKWNENEEKYLEFQKK